MLKWVSVRMDTIFKSIYKQILQRGNAPAIIISYPGTLNRKYNDDVLLWASAMINVFDHIPKSEALM